MKIESLILNEKNGTKPITVNSLKLKLEKYNERSGADMLFIDILEKMLLQNLFDKISNNGKVLLKTIDEILDNMMAGLNEEAVYLNASENIIDIKI